MNSTKSATAPEFTAETGQDKAVPLTKAKATIKKVANKKTTAKAKGTHKPAAKVVKAVSKPKVAKATSPVAAKKTAPKPKPEVKKIGGARAGAGRPVAIKDKHRQTVDFTGDHKNRIAKVAIAQSKGTDAPALGLSPFMRQLLDEFLPVLEARNGIKTPKTK